jgi:hypothetical protein
MQYSMTKKRKRVKRIYSETWSNCVYNFRWMINPLIFSSLNTLASWLHTYTIHSHSHLIVSQLCVEILFSIVDIFEQTKNSIFSGYRVERNVADPIVTEDHVWHGIGSIPGPYQNNNILSELKKKNTKRLSCDAGNLLPF